MKIFLTKSFMFHKKSYILQSIYERLLIVRDVKNLDAILCKKLQIYTFKLNEHFSGKSYTLG